MLFETDIEHLVFREKTANRSCILAAFQNSEDSFTRITTL